MIKIKNFLILFTCSTVKGVTNFSPRVVVVLVVKAFLNASLSIPNNSDAIFKSLFLLLLYFF